MASLDCIFKCTGLLVVMFSELKTIKITPPAYVKSGLRENLGDNKVIGSSLKCLTNDRGLFFTVTEKLGPTVGQWDRNYQAKTI